MGRSEPVAPHILACHLPGSFFPPFIKAFVINYLAEIPNSTLTINILLQKLNHLLLRAGKCHHSTTLDLQPFTLFGNFLQ